jgi:hypothetical protein
MALIIKMSALNSCAQKYQGGQWFEAARLPELAYDHAEIAHYALDRMKAKLEYTNIACNLLPPTFTFAELEELYATVLGRNLDRAISAAVSSL